MNTSMFVRRFLLPWIFLSSLPIIGHFVIVLLPLDRRYAIYAAISCYLSAVVLSVILTLRSQLKDDTKILFCLLSFVSPFAFFLLFMFLLSVVGLFEAT